MSLREQWRELDTAVKVIIGLGVAFFVLVALIVVLVILAAVIGTFALGLGSTVDSPPQAQFEVQYGTVGGSPAATITHSGGDTIDAETLQVRAGDRRGEWPDDDGEVTPGDEITVEVSPGARLEVVWFGDEGSVVLFSEETPPEGNY